MSAHLGILAHAGLLTSRREGRSIIYAADFDGMRSLLAFLLEDCCQGRPDVCRPLIETALPDCCGIATPKGATQ
jgi:hypothetical protein